MLIVCLYLCSSQQQHDIESKVPESKLPQSSADSGPNSAPPQMLPSSPPVNNVMRLEKGLVHQFRVASPLTHSHSDSSLPAGPSSSHNNFNAKPRPFGISTVTGVPTFAADKCPTFAIQSGVRSPTTDHSASPVARAINQSQPHSQSFDRPNVAPADSGSGARVDGMVRNSSYTDEPDR